MDRYQSRLKASNLRTPLKVPYYRCLRSLRACRFWLDCPSGARKGDLVVERGERIFFDTTVWDNAENLARLAEKKQEVTPALEHHMER